MQSVLLASTDSLKLEVLQKVFPADKFTITTVNCDSCGLPPQPCNSAHRCAKIHLDYAKKVTFPTIFDYYIAIENGIDRFISYDTVDYEDICHVLIQHKGLLVHSKGTIEFDISDDKMKRLFKEKRTTLIELNIMGYNRTIRDIIHEECDDEITSVDKCSTKEQIEDSLIGALDKLHQRQDLVAKYKLCTESAMIYEASDIQVLTKLMKSHCKYDNIDYIVGSQLSGVFGLALSLTRNCGFIQLHKEADLPYNTDNLKIATGSRVILFDDLMSNGDSLRATCDALEQLGCVIVDCLVLREIEALRPIARAKLGRPYTVLLQE